MYLKRLELIGFKSFADRTELEFVPGVTAVVGPNGSGKSNVSDAIRWVLGEQSAKSLRGSKMEDIIFAGSDTRKPVNFAEVSLTLDNSDGSLDTEYSEVTVTRRVYRSGDSDYSINKRSCRLKDIMELFMDTGVGKEAYSIIGQGRIEEILSTKSEDRRGIFEEAAGIVKYKTRKREAGKKLDETTQNLVRIYDIRSEVEEQVGPLQEQAEKAKTYKGLHEKLIQHEVALYVQQIEQTHAKWEETKRQSADFENQLAKRTAQAGQQEAELEQARYKVNQIDESIEELQQVLLTVSEEAEKVEGRREVLRERKRNLEANRKQTMEQMHRLTEKQHALEEELTAEEARREEAKGKMREAEGKLKKAESEFQVVVRGLTDDLEKLKSDYFDKLNEMARLRNDIRHQEQTRDTSKARIERLQVDRDRLVSEESTQLHTGEGHATELATIEQKLNTTLTRFRELMAETRGQEQQIEEAEKEIRRLEQQREATRSRLDLLKEMQHDFAGFQQGVKEILRAREKGMKGIHGAVAELMTVPRKVETAIEVALGGALQNVVVNDEAAGREAITYLKRHNLGRATFLPLSVIRSRSLTSEDERQLRHENGVVGIASRLVSFDEAYRAVVESMLGNVIITETLEQANRVARSCHYRYRVVTLEGDIVNAGGSMTGGAVKKNNANLLGRNRQVEELEGMLDTLHNEMIQKKASIDAVTKTAKQAEEQQEKLREQGEVLRLREQELKGLLQQAELSGKSLRERMAVLDQDMALYQKEMNDAEHKLMELTQQLKGLEEEEHLLTTAIATAETRRKEHMLSKEEMNEQITSLKVLVAQVKQEHASRIEQVERLREQRTLLTKEWEEANQALMDLHSLDDNNDSFFGELDEKITELRQDKDRVANLISERRGDRASLFAKQEQLELEVKEIRKQVKALEEKLHAEEVKGNRYEVELDHLLNKLSEEYELSFDLAKQKYPPLGEIAEQQVVVNGLKKQIAALGTVHLGAIEEFDRLAERLDFLRKQEEDLIEAKEMLYQVIAEMDTEMSRRFQQTFDEIRVQFQDVFVQLFGGGRADLLLSQPDRLLETGIDIVAQPPGKKLQNLALLSGGERALTAMALLFAILRVKPVPFCVLDEVEAALDEANVSRFAEYMHHFSGETQFICVTHRKGTMESADVLYGITMQEGGVSKLVSVKLEETKKLIDSAS
ncbi:chromosome segregation protein SMC [Brevibacillus laterosporus]|uniref:chromosome segregation protein SMC n=1 Tax=Brevibacillus laterosporus TaxID=1465 RepID=UPI00215BC5D6|nr:chromosome segregation protein SMC [Brevibacillus laterosporus]MCR8939112.1 chromosome segregation protein SMC [Brevibacillus laterosporus]MCZ0841752.1 chromosome segregation protein SMC [Brevibacillus laterosporus]MCZ0843695.1 chromosome segregation protein SMC [Brevibacillus laterosporus]